MLGSRKVLEYGVSEQGMQCTNLEVNPQLLYFIIDCIALTLRAIQSMISSMGDYLQAYTPPCLLVAAYCFFFFPRKHNNIVVIR